MKRKFLKISSIILIFSTIFVLGGFCFFQFRETLGIATVYASVSSVVMERVGNLDSCGETSRGDFPIQEKSHRVPLSEQNNIALCCIDGSHESVSDFVQFNQLSSFAFPTFFSGENLVSQNFEVDFSSFAISPPTFSVVKTTVLRL